MEPKSAERLIEYFQRCPYPVILVYLFGSAARGETTPLSDLDVAVYLDELDRAGRADLYLPLLAALEGVIGDGEVDLVYLNDAPSGLAYGIITGRLLYRADERRRVEIEAGVLSRYLDEQMLHEARHWLIRRQILAGRMGERGLDMIDRMVINERLEYIHVTLARLGRRRGLPLEEFRADEDGYRASLYDLQTCLEAMADIGNHIIAAMALRKPRDRMDIMMVLAEAGVISKPLGERLGQAQAMRNIIAHGYLDIILDEVYKVIQEDLGSIEEFCRSIVQYIGLHCRGGEGMKGIRVVLADDHPVVRAGIRAELDSADGIEVVGEASSGDEALRPASRGEFWLSRGVQEKVVRKAAGEEEIPFTERELDVLQLLAKGWSNARIAQELAVSERTVRYHLRNIYDKVKVSTRGEAVAWAVRAGFGER